METAKDLIKRNITPILWPTGAIYIQLFAASPDPIYQEISRRFVLAQDFDEYLDMVSKVISTGMFVDMGTLPMVLNWDNPEDEFKNWYRSTETIAVENPYGVHLLNKKWPLIEVLYSSFVIVKSFPNFLLLGI